MRPFLVNLRRRAFVIGAIVATMLVMVIGPTFAQSTNPSISVAAGQTGTCSLAVGANCVVKCPNGILNANLDQSPFEATCNPESTTTTTVAPTTSTTVAPTTTLAPTTTTAATTTTVASGSPFTLVGSFVSDNTSSPAVITNTAVGDLRMVTTIVKSTNEPMSVSGGGVTTWHALPPYNTEDQCGGQCTDAEYTIQLFWGVITSSGPQSVAMTSPGSFSEINTAEFTAGPGYTYSLQPSGGYGTYSISSSNAVFPTLVPSGSDELYFGYAPVNGCVTSPGPTPGFNWFFTDNCDPIAWSGNAPNPSAPTAPQHAAGSSQTSYGSDAIAALMVATPPPNGTTTTTGATTSTTGATTTTGVTTTTAGGTTTTAASAQTCTSAASGNLPPGTAYSDSSDITFSDGSNTYDSQDMWGANSGSTQTSCGPSAVSGPTTPFTVTADMSPADYTGVQTYPDIYQLTSDYTGSAGSNSWNQPPYDFSDTPIDSLNSLTSTYSSVNPPESTGDWEEAFDIWTDTRGELMIWVDTSTQRLNDNGAHIINSNVMIGGVSYTYMCYNATTAACSGGLPQMVLNTNQPSGSVDILAVLKYWESVGTLGAGDHLSAVDFGWELCNTAGQSLTYKITSYSLTAN